MYAQVDDVVDAGFELLDRQIVDCDDIPLGKVDDLECSVADGQIFVSALLCGPGAWAPRIGGRLGAWILAVWRRLHPAANPEPARVPCEAIAQIDSAVHVRVPADVLATNALDEWMNAHLIERLPGAEHAPS